MEDEEVGDDRNGKSSIVEVELNNKFPNIQGFGLDVAGGSDRPFIKQDTGIFISAIKSNGIAEKSGNLNVGDKILEVNGQNVANVSHDTAVKMFVADRSSVKLKIHKNRAQILQAAAQTPTSPPTITPSSRRPRTPEVESGVSLSGFMIGIAFGCVAVVLIKKYMMSSSSSKV